MRRGVDCVKVYDITAPTPQGPARPMQAFLLGVEPRGNAQMVTAFVPLANIPVDDDRPTFRPAMGMRA